MLNTNTLSELNWVIGEQELGPIEVYFSKALRKAGRKVSYINIHKLYSDTWKNMNRYSHRFPRKYDNYIQRKFTKIINDSLKSLFNEQKPSCIFIYNDCRVTPETISYFKKSGAKVIVFLGDDPNYLFPAKKTFLLTVMHADAVVLPDTGWIEGLKMLGVKKIIYSCFGTDPEVFFRMKPSPEQLEKYSCDILFIGTGYYLNSWGIRRAAILNELSGNNFKLFGDNLWYELLPYFPRLKEHFRNGKLYASDVNIACNCAKIYPVVVNAGVVNGVSTRVFDCVSSGIFVLAEYRRDLDSIFPDNEIVQFKSKKELRDKAEYFLKNENERIDLLESARKTVISKYTFDIQISNILEQI